jgi:hypothetical protein
MTARMVTMMGAIVGGLIGLAFAYGWHVNRQINNERITIPTPEQMEFLNKLQFCRMTKPQLGRGQAYCVYDHATGMATQMCAEHFREGVEKGFLQESCH